MTTPRDVPGPSSLVPGQRTKDQGQTTASPESPRSSASQGSGALPSPAPHAAPDVAQLPSELQKLLREMLVDGATIEDAFEALNERPDGAVTFQAVQNFYRSSLDVQAERVERQVEQVKTLKQALANLNDPGMSELADAILMTGLLGVRRGASYTQGEAMKERLARENMRLKNQNLRLRERYGRLRAMRPTEDLELARAKASTERARASSERAKASFLRTKTKLAEKLLEPVEKGGRKLDPKAYQQIREVYGLLNSEEDSSPQPSNTVDAGGNG